MAISGDLAVVSDCLDDTAATDAGAAYFYRFDGHRWSEVAKFTPSFAGKDSLFGIDVALDGDDFLISAARDDIKGSIVHYRIMNQDPLELQFVRRFVSGLEADSRTIGRRIDVRDGRLLSTAYSAANQEVIAGGARLLVNLDDHDGDLLVDSCDNCPDTPNPDQLDIDLDGLGDACDPPGDTDNDGVIGVFDLLAVLGNWGACPPPCTGDTNADGLVNVTDLLIVLANWG